MNRDTAACGSTPWGPAFLPTRLSGFLEDEDQVEWIEVHTALRRPARIDELDGTIVFVAADASSYITGQRIIVDGGWSDVLTSRRDRLDQRYRRRRPRCSDLAVARR